MDLVQITDAILDTMERAFLEVGRLLQEAWVLHRPMYDQWVTECLPFGLNTAQRLRMIWRATQELPPETLARLPKAWQGAFAVTRMPPEQLVAAVESGEVHPAMTVKQAVEYSRSALGRGTRFCSETDIVAAKLCSLPRLALSDETRRRLQVWLNDQADEVEQPPHVVGAA